VEGGSYDNPAMYKISRCLVCSLLLVQEREGKTKEPGIRILWS